MAPPSSFPDKKLALQEQHDARILKLSEGTVQSAFAKLKLEVDVFKAHYSNEKSEGELLQSEKEQRMLQNLTMAVEQSTKEAKELWESHMDLVGEAACCLRRGGQSPAGSFCRKVLGAEQEYSYSGCRVSRENSRGGGI